MSEPTFIWSVYYPAPETKKWRVKGLYIDGKGDYGIDILMYCDKLRHDPKLNMCQVCKERHELPEPSEQRYAYRWYPLKPSIMSVIQWSRRNWERGIKQESGAERDK